MGSGALSCGAKCAKVILFIFNTIFFLSGAALLGIGIWLMVDPNVKQYIDIAQSDSLFNAAAILFICVGAFIFVVGFFGCCGAIRESSCMLCTYIVLIVFIFVIEIVAGILAAVYRNDIAAVLQDTMMKQAQEEVLPLYGEGGNNTAANLGWQKMQQEFMCCGGANSTDYLKNAHFNTSEAEPIPKTCCRLSNADPLNPQPANWELCKQEFKTQSQNPQQLWSEGCRDGLFDWLNSRATILIGIGIGIAIIQLLGILFACCVRREIKKTQKYSA